MGQFRLIENIRPALAVLAALAATINCIRQGHVHIILSEPSTYTSPAHHRCGMLFVVCTTWMVLEIAKLWDMRPNQSL